MKKLFALLAVVLAVVSCQKDADLDVNVGGEQLVNITVTLPEAETRSSADSAVGAFTDGVCTEGVMRYILQVYYNGETNVQSRQVKYSQGPTVSFPVRLVPDRNYQFVVWADVVESEGADSKYYDTADLENITLKADSWKAMDEKRDAFTASETINFNAAMSINIPLYRPFAKLRVVTTDYDVLANIGNGSIAAHHAKVVYTTKHRTSFNAYTSEAGPAYEDKSHVYEIKTYANETGDKHTIFSDYFFAENDVVHFDLEVYEANGTLIKKTSFPTDINVKRNYLTTLIGDVLTVGNNVGVTVVPGFGGTTDPDYNYNVVTNVNDLITAVKNGGNYKIGADLDIDSSLLLATTLAATRNIEPKTTVIDFNGYTITVKNTSDKAIITVGDGNTLVFEGEGSIILTDDSTKSFIDGTVVLEGGVIDNESQTVPVVNGTVYVNGGEVNDAKADANNIKDAAAWLNEVCKNGGTFNLFENLTINATTLIEATKPVVINGNGNTITFTVNRGFRITASNNVAFENVTIVNTADGGRCVETRTGGINLNFNNVNLKAIKGAYTQPFTVGGNGTNITVNFNNSTIKAGHYGITTFNPVALNINNSTISGYAAIYTKAADGSKGSAGSVINVVNSTLEGINNAGQDESNSFSTVAIEDNDITINIDGNSKLVADAGKNAQSLFGIGAGGATEALRGCNIVVAVGAEIGFKGEKSGYVGFGKIQKYLYDNVIKFPAAHAADLEDEGWIVSEPVNGLVTLDRPVVVENNEELDKALSNKDVKYISLCANENAYTIELYTKYPARESLTIIGEEDTKVQFANGQVRMEENFKYFTIENCEILRMRDKTWGHLVFSTGDKADGVYTVKNCTFNGVGTQGIYINEETSGATYNILNCTFNGNFTCNDGAITIQNNAGVNFTVNVTGCEFNNFLGHKIFTLYNNNAMTLYNPDDVEVVCGNRTPIQ